MNLYKTDKTVISFKNNPIQFLNGLTSNDMDKPNNAFLTIHGRIIATFDQIQISDEEIYVIVESMYVDPVFVHLDKYLKLGQVEAQRLSKNVYFDLEGDAPVGDADVVIDQKRGRLIITDQELDAAVTDEDFTLFRLKHNIPLHGIDYKDELLLNVSTEDFVSFTKGCYLGQEPISKVYSKSKPTWRLVVKGHDECTGDEKAKMTSLAIDPESQKQIGFVFEKNT